MISERDWILRMAKQLADFLARALKLGQQRRGEEAQSLLQGACTELFGVEYRILSMVDARSAVELLGDPARGLAFAQLIEAMAGLEVDPLRREARLRHALELVHEVRARASGSAEAAAAEARLHEALIELSRQG
jgi:hypothetical protein